MYEGEISGLSRPNPLQGLKKRSSVSARPMVAFSNSSKSNGTAADHSQVDLHHSTRVALMITPGEPGEFRPQLDRVLEELSGILSQQRDAMEVTVQTVFLRHASNEAECRRVFSDFFGSKMPVTNFVAQPPCSGAALALEAWAIGGRSVQIDRCTPATLSVEYDQVRWIYTAGVKPPNENGMLYDQSLAMLRFASEDLAKAGTSFQSVVRTWFYIGGITGFEGKVERYQELNRARVDFYRDIRFCRSLLESNSPR